MITPSVELHAARLLRAASGDRAIEAAVIMLAQADLLERLHCCITVDADRNAAWIDWGDAATMAERLPSDQRSLVRLAVSVATETPAALEANKRAVLLALEHMIAQR